MTISKHSGFLGRWSLVIVGLLALVAINGPLIWEHYRAKRLVATGQFKTVEGVVEAFIPLQAGGHGFESFSVGGREFQYSLDQAHAGYHQTTGEGGVIKVGEYVKIGYDGDKILRIDICHQKR